MQQYPSADVLAIVPDIGEPSGQVKGHLVGDLHLDNGYGVLRVAVADDGNPGDGTVALQGLTQPGFIDVGGNAGEHDFLHVDLDR